MTNYYTHGSISNVSFDDGSIKFHIKPINEFESVDNKRKYLIFVEDPGEVDVELPLMNKAGDADIFLKGKYVKDTLSIIVNKESNETIDLLVDAKKKKLNAVLVDKNEGFILKENSSFERFLSDLIRNKTVLRFSITKDNLEKSKFEILSINPVVI